MKERELSVRSYADVGQYCAMLSAIMAHGKCRFNFSSEGVQIFDTEKKEKVESAVACKNIETAIKTLGWELTKHFFRRHSGSFSFGRDKKYLSRFQLEENGSLSFMIVDPELFGELCKSFEKARKKYNAGMNQEVNDYFAKLENKYAGKVESKKKMKKKDARELNKEIERKRYGTDIDQFLSNMSEGISKPYAIFFYNLRVGLQSLYKRAGRLFCDFDDLKKNVLSIESKTQEEIEVLRIKLREEREKRIQLESNNKMLLQAYQDVLSQLSDLKSQNIAIVSKMEVLEEVNKNKCSDLDNRVSKEEKKMESVKKDIRKLRKVTGLTKSEKAKKEKISLYVTGNKALDEFSRIMHWNEEVDMI